MTGQEVCWEASRWGVQLAAGWEGRWWWWHRLGAEGRQPVSSCRVSGLNVVCWRLGLAAGLCRNSSF